MSQAKKDKKSYRSKLRLKAGKKTISESRTELAKALVELLHYAKETRDDGYEDIDWEKYDKMAGAVMYLTSSIRAKVRLEELNGEA